VRSFSDLNNSSIYAALRIFGGSLMKNSMGIASEKHQHGQQKAKFSTPISNLVEFFNRKKITLEFLLVFVDFEFHYMI
jgi:hypothetical protein